MFFFLYSTGHHTNLRREAIEEGEPEVNKREREVLVEEIRKELGRTLVGQAAMYEQEALQELKLAKGEVGCKRGLRTFSAGYSYTDVCSLGKR